MNFNYKTKLLSVGIAFSLVFGVSACSSDQSPPPDEERDTGNQVKKREEEEKELQKEHEDTDTEHPEVPEEPGTSEQKKMDQYDENHAG
ncbi:hypothetical protein J7E71_14780 [Mesobacillus foraminis]|uniref:hypothetical protein n=1 Tax=Mesobacillus foraminis TaxID=279826 RepID=UPI001BE60CE3|nr:hypothetical protein [Mesobacillus foraminis]MBT2757190.1 hypothetical protein [Mesobacillus foraminis]